MFLEGQLTLLREGKRLADEIISLESQRDGGGKIDALITSAGFLTFNGEREGMSQLFFCAGHKIETKTPLSYILGTTSPVRRSNSHPTATSEGLDADITLIYYSRFLLTTLLLPLLSRAPAPRVVTVFTAGNEGPFTAELVSSGFRVGFTRLGMPPLVSPPAPHLPQC